MNEIAALSALTAPTRPGALSMPLPLPEVTEAAQAPSGDFGAMLREAISNVDGKVAQANRMVTQFVLDESTPVHQVTIALEEARMAVELAGQVRLRLTEGYREIMNMQL